MRRLASSAVRLHVSAIWLMLVAIGCTAPTQLEAGNTQQALLPSSCAEDTDCGADMYCDVTQSTCVPRRAVGQPLPVDALHDGSCTLQSAARLCRSAACNVAKKTCAGANGTPCNSAAMCASDVCGQNNLCGIEEGGVCDADSASQCQTNRCRVLPGDGQGRCIREGGCAIDDDCSKDSYCEPAAFSCRAKLAAGTPLPTDGLHDGQCTDALAARACGTGLCSASSNTCAALNGASCDAANQCVSGACGNNGRCGLAVGEAGCTTETQGALCQSGSCAASGVCVPESGCNVDADCAASSFCKRTDHACVARLREGKSLPKDGLHDGLCSEELARVACASGLCNAVANSCAAATNAPCTDPWQCVTNVCADNGKCGEKNGLGTCADDAQCQSGKCHLDTMRCVASEHGCTRDDDCPSAQYCNLTQLRCVDDLANGTLLPVDSAAGGTCTSDSARSVCASGACNAANDTCAKLAGRPCSQASECAADVCDEGVCGHPDGSRGACTADDAVRVCQSGICQQELSRCSAVENGCSSDRDCAQGKYCDGRSLACVSKLASGSQLQEDELHAATCSTALAAVVCESAACNHRTNACANVAGMPCSLASDCASDACLDSRCAPESDVAEDYRLGGGGCTIVEVASVKRDAVSPALALLWLVLAVRRRRERQACR